MLPWIIALLLFLTLVVFAIINRHVVPEPDTLMLLGTGLIGLAGLVRRRMADPQDSSKE